MKIYKIQQQKNINKTFYYKRKLIMQVYTIKIYK